MAAPILATSFDIATWLDGKTVITGENRAEVHIYVNAPQIESPVLIRITTREIAEQVIEQLRSHTETAFPMSGG